MQMVIFTVLNSNTTPIPKPRFQRKEFLIYVRKDLNLACTRTFYETVGVEENVK